MSMKDFSLEGKIALVTGAGRGMGKTIATTLAEAGADIIAVARTAKEIEQTAKDVQNLGRRAIAISTDISQSDQVDVMAKQAMDEFGRVDILVNNAGVALVKPLVPLPGYKPPGGIEKWPEYQTALSDQQWYQMLNINFSGPFFVMRALVPQMLERKWGRVINVTSASALRTGRFIVAYEATKGGLITLTRTLAAEWARYNVTVNSIAPGFFLTPMTTEAYENPQYRQSLLNKVPMRKAGDVRELGVLAVYLACDASSYLTGQVIGIDGGMTL